jgi:hypothetical protein
MVKDLNWKKKIMIKKEEKIIKEHTTIVKIAYCDLCGNSIKEDAFYSHKHCIVCRRDVCGDCLAFLKTAVLGGYPDIICIDCEKNSKSYYEKIEELELEYDEKYDDIKNKMKKFCLEQIEKGNNNG